jgi:hypothetical protein
MIDQVILTEEMHQWIQFGRRAIERSLLKALIRSLPKNQDNQTEWEELQTVLQLFNKWMPQYELPEPRPPLNVDEHGRIIQYVQQNDQITLHEWIECGRTALFYARMDVLQYCHDEPQIEFDHVKKMDTLINDYNECLKHYELPRNIHLKAIINQPAANDPACSNTDQ